MSSKGKAVGTDKGKGKWTGDEDRTGGGRKRRNREVLQFFENAAEEGGYDSSEDSNLKFNFDYFMDEDNIELKVEKEPPKAQNVSFMPKEEEMDQEEFDRMMEERYKSNPSLRAYRDDVYNDETNSMPSAKTPTIWKVKCTVGRERHSVFCLMQKFVELKSLGNKLQIISAFVVDHTKGFIYIETEKQININEACKGLSTIYSSRLAQVPKNEVSHLLTIRNNMNPISEGMCARVKNGRNKGDLAQQITGSAFSSGTVVEVNLDRENVHDAWFQAVVIRENGDQTYFVKRIGPNNDDRAALKVTVDSLHIRPIPPHFADRVYKMLDKVDVPYDFGWRAGLIINLRSGRRYGVFFKHENEVKELGHSEIRPHADWLDGKWVTTSQGEVVVVNQEQLSVAQSVNKNPEVNLEHENTCAGKVNTVEESPSTWRMTEHDMLKSEGGGGQGKKRKRGRPRKIVGKAPEVSVAGMEVHVAGDIADEMTVEGHTSNESELPVQVVVESKVVENEPIENTRVSDTESTTKDADEAFAGVPKDSRLFSGEAATGLDETRERKVVPLESCPVNAKDNSSLTRNPIHNTTFIKKSPVWKTIETLEVFQTVPQNPHFHPLYVIKEEYREETAIGIMYKFAHLVENICSLQFEDPWSIFDGHLNSLVDLEKHGLDVVMIRDRVNELLSMKDVEGEVLNELKDAETQLREHTVVRSVLDGVVNDIEKKIMELPKELAAAKSKVEAKDHEISELETRADSANRRINMARYDFEKLATAPWKMPWSFRSTTSM